MQVWAVVYDPAAFSDDLYQRGILRVDLESRARIRKFYRREDACRTLISRLLPRMLLTKHGVAASAMTFASTKEGKPYITTPGIPPLAYNISHDNNLIVMAFAPGIYDYPAFRVGVDVMRVKLRNDEQFASFVDVVGSQLTPLEHDQLSSVSADEALKRFFWMWTMKEAYTKALGLGLGFEFTRIQYDVQEDVVTIDGKVPAGWEFTKFELEVGLDLYQGVAAEFVGGDGTKVQTANGDEWLVRYDAISFVHQAIEELT